MAQPMIIISLTVVLMCCCSPRKARDKPQLSKKARMPSKNKRKTSNSNPLIQQKNSDALNLQIHNHLSNDCCFEGDRLFSFLNSFQRLLESELQSNKRLPEKLWLKQHFAVGINEVTRLLERTLPCKDETFAFVRQGSSLSIINRGQCYSPCPATELQAVLVASDCNSRWLTKHLPTLASSRNVPLIYVKDNKEGSLRLGEAVKVKTAIALGIKVKGSSINQLIEEVLHQEKLNGTGRVDSTELPAVSC